MPNCYNAISHMIQNRYNQLITFSLQLVPQDIILVCYFMLTNFFFSLDFGWAFHIFLFKFNLLTLSSIRFWLYYSRRQTGNFFSFFFIFILKFYTNTVPLSFSYIIQDGMQVRCIFFCFCFRFSLY
jgi:hypothetical protein